MIRRNRPQDMTRLNEARCLYDLIRNAVVDGVGIYWRPKW